MDKSIITNICKQCSAGFRRKPSRQHELFCKPECKSEWLLTDDAFFSKVNKNGETMQHMETPCHEWIAGTFNVGYGCFRRDGKSKLAHRVAWGIANGSIPDGDGYHGTCVLHRCDNRKCVNPEHLFLGTAKDNMRDMIKKGRDARIKGESCSFSKLNEVRVKIIRSAHPLISGVELAKVFGVTPSLICSIRKRRVWKHI